MNSLFALVLFVVICLGSLLVVSWANHKETRKRLIRSRIKVLKAQYEELQQIIASVDQTVELRAISRVLNEEAIQTAQAMSELEPEDGYVIAALNNSLALQNELNKDDDIDRIYRIRSSDSQIAVAQRELEKAANTLSRKHSLGEISPDEFNTYRTNLAWSKLMLSVLSFVAQGHQAINRGETLPAMAFYQKAKSCLAHSSHPDRRRNEMIKQLAEIISKRRQSLSVDLMPETDFNPDMQKPSEDGEPKSILDDDQLTAHQANGDKQQKAS